jgi:hypothetical protein
LRCSPSVITGEPVASNSLTVSRTAASYSALSVGLSPPSFATASMRCTGREILPIGSVGMDMRTREHTPAGRANVKSRDALSGKSG